ncbi:MAG: hypothetical protein PHP08_02225 [Candidatus Dojkabacteria bacterium]|nr:hypothetical protein [Candidatus Dojkabacteria bacterium]
MREREKTVFERIEECQKIRHGGRVESLNGKAVEDIFGEGFAEDNQLDGYVISSKLYSHFRNSIEGAVYPCIRRRRNKEREEQIAENLGLYYTDQIMGIVIYNNAEEGPKGGFIRKSDLAETPSDLIIMWKEVRKEDIRYESQLKADGISAEERERLEKSRERKRSLGDALSLAYEVRTGEELSIQKIQEE